MDFKFQQEALKELDILSKKNTQSIIIEGQTGCGKTYLAKKYADMLNTKQFYVVQPTVAELRDVINASIELEQKTVLCIENLDTGVLSASYTILKFLEEPYPNIYIIVTCRNILKIPDTIISRSVCVTIGFPTKDDIKSYCKVKYPQSYKMLYSKDPLVLCMTTFSDADTLCSLTEDKLDYIISTKSIHLKTDPVSNTVWSLGHFPDRSECPVDIVIRYIARISNSIFVQQCASECAKELLQKIIPKHQALTKFVMDLKYVDW